MKPYTAMLAVRFKNMLQYRSAALAGFACQWFWGMIMIMVYEAFFSNSFKQQPMSFAQTVSYIWLGQAFLGLLPWNPDGDFQELVGSGAIAYELLRPLDLYNLWYVRSLAQKIGGTILRALPMLLLTSLIYPWIGAGDIALVFPATPLRLIAFLIAMIGVIFLSTAITAVINISLIWTISGRGIAVFFNSIVTLFSGMIIPLPFFPDWTQWLFAFLPFRGVVDAPYRIFMGHIPASGYAGVYIHQIVWIAFFIILGRFLVQRAARKLVVQGG